jgi:uracil-DNA glycosylase family 4
MKIRRLKLYCEQSECPLHEREDFIPCEINLVGDDSKLNVLFVGEGPGKTEVNAEIERPFIGRSGKLLRRTIKSACGGEPFNYGFTNTVRCLPLNKDDEIRPPTRREQSLCRKFLDRDIQKTDPDVIVLLGRSPLEAFPPPGDYTVAGERGNWRLVEIEGRERVVFSTWHPAYVGRQKKVLPVFYEDIRTVFKLATGWRPNPQWAGLGKSELLTTIPDIEEYVDFLRRGLTLDDMVSVDVETKTLTKMYGNKLGMIQFTHDLDSAMCIPLDHPKTPFDAHELGVIKAILRRLFTKKVSFGYWLAHAGKFEQTLIGRHILGGKLNRTFKNRPMIDTMGGAYLLNENLSNIDGERSYRLKLLVKQILAFFHYDDETLKKRSEGNLFDLPLESTGKHWVPNLTDYGGMDVYTAMRLFTALKEMAQGQHYFHKWMALLVHLFSPVYRLMSVMERNGFWANISHLHMLKDPDRSPIISRLNHIDKVEYRQFETAKAANAVLAKQKSGGNEPLFGSSWVMDLDKPDHVREWLINQCKLESVDTTKGGLPSVGKSFFAFHDGVPEVEMMKERRGLAKLATSYVNQLIAYLDPSFGFLDSQDGRIRADFHFAAVVSGRAACTKPNMHQQVKSDSPEKAAIKSIFQAEQPGVQDSFKIDFTKGRERAKRPYAPLRRENAIVQLDHMTNEVRWWCILSGCKDLAEALNNGKAMRDAYRLDPHNVELREKALFEGDLHRNTAALMYGVAVKDVTKAMRNAAKSIVFGWMFGRGVHAIAAQIGRTVKETTKLIDQFGSAFPAGRDWLHGQPGIARERWYVESPIGRRRRLPGYVLLPAGKMTDEKWWDLPKDDRRLIGECDRMAMNSAIQGIASDAAFIGGTLLLDFIEDNDRVLWLIQNAVHDSCVNQVPIDEVVEFVHIAEELFTTRTMEYMTEHWGVEFPCPLEVDFEIGPKWGELMKWDGTKPEMSKIITALGGVEEVPELSSSTLILPKKKAKKLPGPESRKLF